MKIKDALLSIYFHCPIWVQNLLCTVEGYRIYKKRFGKEFKKIYASLLLTENYTKEQIRKYKEEHLSEILHYAYNHCPFYRRKFDAAGVSPDDFKVLEDLRKFPVLTKDEVRENIKDMISDEYKIKDLIPYHTSGSTGKSLNFYWTKENLQYYWAAVIRGKHHFGVKLKDRQLDFTGKLVVPLSQNKPPYWRYNKALNQFLINQQHITAEKVPSIVSFINKSNIVFFSGYPSIVYTLAMHINAQGFKITNPPHFFFSGAEKVYGYQKIAIEKAFPGIKIMETYSFSEEAGSMHRYECGHYHEDFEFGHFELADPSKKTDRLLVTGFQNFGMPFIRYEIGDMGTIAEDDYSCKLQSAAFEDIEGRNEDYIITNEGQHLTRLDYLFKDVNYFEAQIIQHEVGSILIRAVPNKNSDIKKDEDLIRDEVYKHFSKTLKVYFEYVDEIPRTQAGKFKFLISEISSEEKANFAAKLAGESK